MGEFAFPFGLGLLAAFNPCGFAMLPAYLSYFLGIESKDHGQRRLPTVVRGLAVGLVMTLGFVVVFGSAGILFATIVSQGDALDVVPYVIIAVGVVAQKERNLDRKRVRRVCQASVPEQREVVRFAAATELQVVLMIPLGISLLMGRQLNLRLPKMNRGTGSRNMGSVFMFGVSYAVVSLSCTIPLFIAGVADTFTDDGIATGTGNFLAYAIGMGMVITFLTMSLALAKSNVAVSMRRVLPYVGPISGVVLVVAGIYMIDYGIWDYQLTIANNIDAGNLMVDEFLEFQNATNNWIQDATTERIGLISLMGIVGILVLAWRDDITDRVQRVSVTAIYLLSYLFVEIYNRGEFIFLPLVRFVANWPARIGNWFTDPGRAGVILEIAFVALVAWFVARRVRRYRPSHAPRPVGAS